MASSERIPIVPAQVDPATVRQALESILQSTPFRTSRQCQDMLRYVVEHSLRDEQESLRERVIGIEVFGRSSDYDTSVDPVVRIRAADIRKRLAQYYQNEAAAGAPVHIEIPSGSYRAIFKATGHGTAAAAAAAPEVQQKAALAAPFVVAPVVIEEEPARPRSRWRGLSVVVAAVAVVLLAAGGMWFWRSHESPAPGPYDAFWAPVFASRKPVMIYAGANAVYRLSDRFLEQYRKEHHLENTGPEFFPELSPNQKIAAGDLVRVGDTTADGRACALLVSVITRSQRPFELRYGEDISVGDLQDSPTILVGAFNNSWTLKMSSALRYVFRGGNRIEDSWGKMPGWSVSTQPGQDTHDDYAVVSRLIDPKDGHVMIMAAGIGSYGTEAAAEFLLNPRELADLARKLPPGWQKKNLQAVLRVRVQEALLNNEEIVATQSW